MADVPVNRCHTARMLLEVIRMALTGTPFDAGLPDLAVLAGFTAVLFALAVWVLGHHID